MESVLPYAIAALGVLFSTLMGVVVWVVNRFVGRLDGVETSVIDIGREVSRLVGILEGKS